ncbi:MAG TPA: hypothetical protein VGI39_12380 [Polyangiaceae bacterium]|jgi:hypothetical protein
MSVQKPLLDWQRVTEDTGKFFAQRDHTVMRAKVPGGWLVAEWLFSPARDLAALTRTDPRASGGGLVFVPDPEHKWGAD